MTQNTLHYIYDPLCGWCYAAKPLMQAAISAGVSVVLHGGALWGQPTRLDAEKRNYIRQSDARIAVLSGVPFGTAYFEGVLGNPDAVFWSPPTIAAVLAAGMVRPGADLDMLQAVQKAQYVSGRPVTNDTTLINLAGEVDLPLDDFTAAMSDGSVDTHIAETRRLMGTYNLRGFPSFLLQVGDTLIRVPHEGHYAHPNAFVVALREAAANVAKSPTLQP